ncbi:response regulator transcription factor [Mesorhizobium sp. M1C.F.Ca.ET.193.01.1.1]|uniref:response regulator transcription factor n=1 Tax=unclassified Mesorhizobium TaxID=325217 RepID=UPI000FD25985|nr:MULTISPECIES: response regulator transcription factor [unclassified Mesorhizobium]TGT04268.1 response regulator transcription factor [bacterium M00.F.Ca.ET.177.01.1.1]TGQ56858.1 response regulator transcription factor [Mesorhizobium sp. M1C.F.Ca.ET.210.01.1.1]TGQ75625.1 response regulator transcription factor [Mesorhizobium sp. M1C.F.Ca.ET.212.01.1.1]TGR14034.1 response regulator transcription factor [Mesorhizobium sp. M1C.F.Ca.ET.204.01.1.1]TGR34289.1 response regulator transcription facto
MRILLVEDEPEMVSALRSALKRHDMVVDHAASLQAAEGFVAADGYDAILLDRQLPDGDGLALVPRLRKARNTTPVLMLTARGDTADKVDGLDMGADDYLAKPFAFEELLARLRALLRRPATIETQAIRAGHLTLDVGHREASIRGEPFTLPRRELLVLETLMRRTGRMVQREALMEAVFGLDDEIQSNALDTHVSRLRRKLTEADSGVAINGIRGVGYLLREIT